MIRTIPFAVLTAAVLAGFGIAADDVNEANEKAMKAAALKAAPWTVKIETSGGLEKVGGAGKKPGPQPKGPAPGILKGVGPTTGVVVDAEGYIVSSAFNFANNPGIIYVSIPGRPRDVATVVCTDTTRMLTLLKTSKETNLPVAPAFPKKDFAVGQWSLALGRTLDPDIVDMPSISAGIVSATGRIFGKAVQTDAKVSPVNYGGPLVAIDGRAIGVLVPASPRGDDATAGFEWYDSGIGFAVPMEDIYAVLPRMKKEKELRRGLLGFSPKSQEEYLDPIEVGTLAPDGAAARAGIKVGDRIVAFDGKPVKHFSGLQHLLSPKYEGDTVSVTVRRGDKDETFPNLVLGGAVAAVARPFLGVLGMRDDSEAGMEIRYVYPKSPAESAKLAAGDRLLKVGPAAGPALTPIANRTQLATMIGQMAPGTKLKFEVKKKGADKPETVEVTLATATEDLPAELPLPSSKEKAGAKPGPAPKKDKDDEAKKDDEDEPETGLLKRTNEVTGRESWIYVPESYKKSVSHGVIVWFHAKDRGGKDAEDIADIWKGFCERYHFIVIGPKSKNKDGWLPSETEEVVQDVKKVLGEYTTDPNRVIAHGMGIGGQMAFYLGFNARDVFRGVAVTGAVLGTQPKDRVPNQPLSFFIVAGEKDPLLKEIVGGKDKLEEKKYPVIYRQIADFGKQYLDEKSFQELRVWMDSLDRI